MKLKLQANGKGLRFVKLAYQFHISSMLMTHFLMEAIKAQFLQVKSTLDTFSLWSGQQINKSKSSLVFSPSTSHDLRNGLSAILGIPFTRTIGKYLGTHIDPGRSKHIIYDQVLSAISSRTASWKNKLLSQASRLTLVKFVLSAANIYLVTSIRLPQYI